MKWISVKDSLPEEGSVVIALAVGEGMYYIIVAQAHETTWFDHNTGEQIDEDIRYWLELPPPPTEDEEFEKLRN